MTMAPHDSGKATPIIIPQGFVDADFYLKQYPDVAAANYPPHKHYFEHGWREDRQPNPLFDPAYYAAQVGDTLQVPALLHYLKAGFNQPYRTHPLFDPVYYLERYPDLADDGVVPLLHYLSHGASELRSPHPLFDAAFYVEQLNDAERESINPLMHYLEKGWRQGVNPHPLFDTAFYLAQAEPHEVIAGPALVHYLEHGAQAGRAPHPLFDPEYYRVKAGPVADPLVHYLLQGCAQGLNPHPRFNTRHYLEHNPDVVALGTNPLVHFVLRGAEEGRSPCAEVSGAWLRSHSGTVEGSPWRVILEDRVAPAVNLAHVLAWQYGETAEWALSDPRLLVKNKEDATFASIKLAELKHEVLYLAAGLPRLRRPDVSIVVPVHNKLVHTLGCLRSILRAGSHYRFEVIVADDASTDGTAEFLAGLPGGGIRSVQHPEPQGFLGNCNAAARLARGGWIVLLNNDTIVLPGWLEALIETFKAQPKAGLVGAKLIYPDGRLQECGGVVWRDAQAWNIGRDLDPRLPIFNYLREVDYCSGAAIAVPTALWRELEGFDPRYAPAYYEDTDLAFRIRAAGYQVWVQPMSCVVHFEGVSHGKSVNSGIKQYQEINRKTFLARWRKKLSKQPKPPSVFDVNVLQGTKRTVLVVDAEVPRPDQDSGSNDTYQYIRALLQFGYHVVFMAQNALHLVHYTRDLQGMGVECLYAPYVTSLHEAVRSLQGRIHAVLVFRFYVAQELLPALKELAPEAKVILETVDLHYLRETRMSELSGLPSDRERAERTRQEELAVIDAVDAAIVLSEHELQVLRQQRPNAKVHCIPILRELPELAPTPLEKRDTLLFVGGFRHPPNIDGITWFVSEVWPQLKGRGFTGKLVIVGSEMPEDVKRLASRKIKALGFVEDLAPLFARSRASIAPLRYGAGLKGKIITSLSYGVPCISTSIGVEGSGLVHGQQVLVADTPEVMADEIMRIFSDSRLWQKLSDNSRAYFRENFSTDSVFPMIYSLIKSVIK